MVRALECVGVSVHEKNVCVHERVVMCVNEGEMMCAWVFVDAKEETGEILSLPLGGRLWSTSESPTHQL